MQKQTHQDGSGKNRTCACMSKSKKNRFYNNKYIHQGQKLSSSIFQIRSAWSVLETINLELASRPHYMTTKKGVQENLNLQISHARLASNLNLSVQFLKWRSSSSHDSKDKSKNAQDSKNRKSIINERTANEFVSYKYSQTIIQKSRDLYAPYISNPGTHARKFKGHQPRGGRESFYTNIGITSDVKDKGYWLNPQTKFNRANEIIYGKDVHVFYVLNKPFRRQGKPKDNVDNSTLGQTDSIKSIGRFFKKGSLQPIVDKKNRARAPDVSKNEDNTFKKLYNIFLESKDFKSIAKNFKQLSPLISTHEPACNCCEAKTQSRRYGGRQQRAGREVFYRDIGTSGIPKCKKNIFNTELNETSREEEVYYGNDEHIFCDTDCYRTTKNKRIGPNYGLGWKSCNNMSQDIQKCKSSTLCQGNSKRNEDGVFKRLFRTLVENKNIPQVPLKRANSSILRPTDDTNNENEVFSNTTHVAQNCNNSSSLCHIESRNENNIFKKVCHLLLEPKINPEEKMCCRDRSTICKEDGINNKDSVFKKFLHLLIEPNEYSKVNKWKQLNSQIPVYFQTETMTQSHNYGGQQQAAWKEFFYSHKAAPGAQEIPKCVQPTTAHKAVGIGTDCNIILGWYKDRYAYGEPKPQAGTKIGASLKTDSAIKFYNTATQSRKCRNRDLRAGRKTFYRDKQTLCVPKGKKGKLEEYYNNVAPYHPVQPTKPERQALRLGSNCSFCFELYKDVPPESPGKSNSKPVFIPNEKPEKYKRNFISNLSQQRQGLQENIIKTGVRFPGRSDACTCTEVCECENKNNVKSIDRSKGPDREPLHFGSSVKFNFNFMKSISPPKKTTCPQQDEQCKCDSECVPVCVSSENNDVENNILSSDTNKLLQTLGSKPTNNCLLDLLSKKNFIRLINGINKKEVRKKIPTEKQMSNDTVNETIPVRNVCETKCRPDPLRIGSSFSFNYDVQNVAPKPKAYVEKFPSLEDFSGSSLKMNMFRLIIGKIRKRIRTKDNDARIPSPCDPKECHKRKQGKTWFSYILSHIKQERKVSSSTESDAKKFFSDILSETSDGVQSKRCRELCGPGKCSKRKRREDGWFSYILSNIKQQRHASTTTESETTKVFSDVLSETSDESQMSQSRRCRERPRGPRNCCKRRRRDYGWFSYILSNIREERKRLSIADSARSNAESFFSQMLAEDLSRIRSCNCNRRRRRRRRRTPVKGIPRNNAYDSSSLTDSTEFSRLTDSCRHPCQIKSECSFNYDYNTSDGSDHETRSMKSTTDSRNYATT